MEHTLDVAVGGLKTPPKSDTIPSTPFDIKAYAEMQLLVLTTQLNYWRKVLGMNPKRCKHCGEEWK